MKIYRGNNKGQAMAEFIIMLPLLLLMFIGILQFFLLSVDRIKLEMTAREVMRFVTTNGEDQEKLEAFAKEFAGNEGLNSGNLTVIKGEKQEPGIRGKMAGFAEKFTGVKIKLEYYRQGPELLKRITGKNGITLKTEIFTATGGLMKFVLSKKDKDALEDYRKETADESPVD